MPRAANATTTPPSTTSSASSPTREAPPDRPPPTAPDTHFSNHTPTPSTTALLTRLQACFQTARHHCLCPKAAALHPTATSKSAPMPGPTPSHQPAHRECTRCDRLSPAPADLPDDEPSPDPAAAPTVPTEPEEDMSALRLRLSLLDDSEKMTACRDKLMRRYNRSKALELHANVRALFNRQYTREFRPPAPEDDATALGAPEEALLGCEHYARNCKLKASCCGLFVSCRFCHDDAMAEDHEMDRFATETILCMVCLTEQSVSPACLHCAASFAHYFCEECRFFENTPGKNVYHCSRCNICRLGEGLGIDNYHCDTCDACVSLKSKAHHRCMSNALHANCPVCRGYLFTSTEPVVFMRCGHTMHSQCFDEYIAGSYQCPLCMRSLTNMDKYFAQIDELVRREPMPAEYKHKRSLVLCNDCGNKCVAKYHFVYHKCASLSCKSYNTKVLDVFEVEPDPSRTEQLTKADDKEKIETLTGLHADEEGMMDGGSSAASSSTALFPFGTDGEYPSSEMERDEDFMAADEGQFAKSPMLSTLGG